MNIVADNNKPDFITLLSLQIRVIHALILREILTRFGTRKLGYIWTMAEPLIHVSIFSFMRFFLGTEDINGINPIIFLITGIVPFFFLRSVISKGMVAVSSNKTVLVFSQINLLDLFFARFFLEIASYFLVFILALFLADLFIADVVLGNILGALYAFSMLALIGLSVALIMAPIVTMFDSTKVIVMTFLRFSYFTSGIMFSINAIPDEYQEAVSWNPIVVCIEIFRDSLLREYKGNEVFMDDFYMLSTSLFMLFLGLLFINRMKRWVLK